MQAQPNHALEPTAPSHAEHPGSARIVGGSGGKGRPTAEMDERDWDATIDGYLKSVWLCMKHELLEMLKRGAGVIVNNSSVDGIRAYPFPTGSAYSAAKHGVIGLTKSAALEYASRGIRINAICPGWVRTPPVEHWMNRDPKVARQIIAQEPIGRLGTPVRYRGAVQPRALLTWIERLNSGFLPV